MVGKRATATQVVLESKANALNGFDKIERKIICILNSSSLSCR